MNVRVKEEVHTTALNYAVVVCFLGFCGYAMLGSPWWGVLLAVSLFAVSFFYMSREARTLAKSMPISISMEDLRQAYEEGKRTVTSTSKMTNEKGFVITRKLIYLLED